MKIDRYMVTLFFEIKRNLPKKSQADMQISNPQIGEVMVNLYHTTADDNIKLLTEVFLERAGQEWSKRIKPQKRLYRGQEVLNETSKTKRPKAKSKSKRIYRGQVVD